MIVTLTLFLALLIGEASSAGTYCIALPSNLPSGASCGNGISCQYGLYCNQNGLCAPLVGAGGSCLANSNCVLGTTCKGPAGSLQCITNANPGQSCNNDLSVTTPYCGTGSCVASVCVNGNVGDTCILTSNCISGLTCTNGLCSNVTDGTTCTSSNMCSPLSYCTSSLVCQPLLTSGVCTSSASCAYGYGCIGVSSTDQSQCVAYGSRTVGQYCGTNGLFCQHPQRCTGGYCAAKDADLCSSSSSTGCSVNELCTCEDRYLVSGYGTCSSNPCFNAYNDYNQCISLNCNAAPTNEYSGSCRNRTCAAQFQKYSQCSSADSMFNMSLVIVALFAMIASWVSF